MTNTNTNTDTTNTNENTDTNVNTESTATETNTESEVLTLEAVKKLIQSETDKVRTEYVKKLKAKESEIEEVKKNNMTEQEKLDYEKKQLEDVLSERERALQEKEQAFNRSQLELQAIDLLKEQSLPLEAKTFLIGADIDVTTDNINTFKVMFDEAVEKEVKSRIKGTSKQHKTTNTSTSITKDDFRKMTWKERSELYNTNQELYKELNK